MVTARPGTYQLETTAASVRILAFSVSGGIFPRNFRISFPEPPTAAAAPLVLILSGKNGSGKTTLLRTISGALEMNFDVFRNVPFLTASMELSDGNVLAVEKTSDRECLEAIDTNTTSFMARPNTDRAKSNI
jgi:hypothetical protein